MNKKKFLIISPAGNPTGGVELLHQMAHILLEEGHEVQIMYWPLRQEHNLINFYKDYLKGVTITEKVIDDENIIIILPEVFSYFIKKIKKAKIIFWWLSVDNYINSKKIMFAIGNKFTPYTYWNVQKDNRIYHAVQSEYAKLYLKKFNVETNYFISDYINDEYFSEYSQKVNLSNEKRKNIVLYNPAKGGDEQKRFIQYLESEEINCMPLKGMDKQMMIKTLGEAKVYIDFGEHPGKDRIPREAALLGCIIITNKKGSAANPIDVKIPDEYKFSQTGNYFELVKLKIDKIFNDFGKYTNDFEIYRQSISVEKNLFIEQVKLFSKNI